jgi:branched-chain amino acid transport system substrate-binding protein
MKKLFLMPLVVVLFSALILGGSVECATAKKVIKIGVQADASGPCASCGSKQLEGFTDYVKYQNEVLGGIKGIPVKAYADDMKYKIPLAMDIYERQKSEGVLMHSIACSGAQIACMPRYDKDKIASISFNFGLEQICPPRSVFWPNCGYGDSVGGFIDWALKKWTKKRPMKVAFIFPDCSYGWATLQIMPYLEHRGVQVVAKEIVTWKAATTITPLTRIKAKDPDYIFPCYPIGNAMAIILKDAATLGIPASKFVGMIYTLHGPGIKMAGPAAEGAYGVSYHKMPGDYNEVPGVKMMIDWYKKVHGTDMTGMEASYVSGWIIGMMDCKVIEKTLDKVDFKDLNGEAIMKHGFPQMKNIDSGGLYGPITWDPDGGSLGRIGSRQVCVQQVIDGKMKTVTDWLTTPIMLEDSFITIDGKTVKIKK